MKLIILSLILTVALQNAFAQNTVYPHQDTVPNIKLVLVDTHLFFPVLKTPLHICDSMQNIFNEYILTHKEVINKFDFMNDSSNYYGSVWFDIDKSGGVFNLKPRKFYSPIDSFCTMIFAPLLLHTKWKPFYRKTQRLKKYLNTVATMSFEIYKGRITSLDITELKTGKSFFKCKN